ncbi:hypothetical protein [Leptospira santarosai]|nr:hypothetical protein [Leptospira santarosai]MDI7213294.1 hypothetical protein [Leptospira santarosai]
MLKEKMRGSYKKLSNFGESNAGLYRLFFSVSAGYNAPVPAE